MKANSNVTLVIFICALLSVCLVVSMLFVAGANGSCLRCGEGTVQPIRDEREDIQGGGSVGVSCYIPYPGPREPVCAFEGKPFPIPLPEKRPIPYPGK